MQFIRFYPVERDFKHRPHLRPGRDQGSQGFSQIPAGQAQHALMHHRRIKHLWLAPENEGITADRTPLRDHGGCIGSVIQ